jgi:uncharacterized protein
VTGQSSARHEARVFFSLAFAASWGIGGVGLLIDRAIPTAHALGTGSPLYYLAAYAISLVGILLTVYYSGLGGVRRLAHRLVPRQRDGWAYLVVIVGFGAVTGIAMVTAGGVGITARLPWAGMLLQLTGALIRDPGPLGEEFGWRGFALPRLIERFSPRHAAILLGLIHTLWHVPLFFIGDMPQAHVFFPTFAVGVLAIAVIDTFLYLRTDGNLLLAILVHLLANVGGGIAASGHALNAFFVLEGLVAGAVFVNGAFTNSRTTTSAVAPTG